MDKFLTKNKRSRDNDNNDDDLSKKLKPMNIENEESRESRLLELVSKIENREIEGTYVLLDKEKFSQLKEIPIEFEELYFENEPTGYCRCQMSSCHNKAISKRFPCNIFN